MIQSTSPRVHSAGRFALIAGIGCVGLLWGEGDVERAAHGEGAALENVCVNHRCFDILMTQQFLDGADVVSVFEQVCGKAVAEGVRGDALGDAGQLHCSSQGFTNGVLRDVVPAFLA